jgi:hypothetical protein
LYRKIYKMPTPYLPLFSAFPSAHAQANNPESHSNTRNIFDNKRPAGVGNAMFATLTLHYQPNPPVRFPSWRCRIAAHEATAPIQQRQPHAKKMATSSPPPNRHSLCFTTLRSSK